MNSVSFNEYSSLFLEKLSHHGVLLTVKNGDRLNTMTIGWGSLSFYWGRPVLIVPVRQSRYTHDLIQGTREFTVSVPKGDELEKALSICGTKSGRDIDKFETCGLTAVPGRKVDCPIIGQGFLHYECRILGQTDLSAEILEASVVQSSYRTGDFHTLYFGEIIDCYIKD